ncbi:LacI family DNA-binding transcriptional regulator [Microbacterium sp. 179-B 1A2 NHS]|uniref:LacI family DNA-binding transcriptional regulator n=1 Tax=Microbacterium sp. 179-B 1A2 NHS TaxID=3142383 RepID=UPI0039A02009
MRDTSVTIQDVARAAGVSRQTVSNVLNTPAIVRAETRDRVQQAIDRMGYAPHASARRLRTRRSATIGIHLDPYAGGISGVVLDRFVHALTEHAGERGLRVLVYAASDHDEEIRRMADLVDGGDVDAVVITGTAYGDRRIDWLTQRAVPFVSFGRPWGADDVDDPTYLWVDVDGATGTRAATAHALNRGPRVAFLGWPAGSATGDDRERGWREAMAAAGAPAELRLVAEETVSEARDRVAELLSARAVDAVVCASDTLAVGAHVAAVAGHRPDLAIVGFDNTPAAEALGISSVEQLPELVAAGTLDLLMAGGPRIERRTPTPGEAHVLVEPRLVVR